MRNCGYWNKQSHSQVLQFLLMAKLLWLWFLKFIPFPSILSKPLKYAQEIPASGTDHRMYYPF